MYLLYVHIMSEMTCPTSAIKMSSVDDGFVGSMSGCR